jgi:hypothetical protein
MTNVTGQNTKKSLFWLLRKLKYNIFNQGKAKAPVTIILFDIKDAWQAINGLLKKISNFLSVFLAADNLTR